MWRAVTDVLSHAYDILRKPEWYQHNRQRFISGLKTLGFHDAAETYLDLNYKPSNVTNISEESVYDYQKGDLSCCREAQSSLSESVFCSMGISKVLLQNAPGLGCWDGVV